MRAVVFAYSNVGDRCLRVLHAAGVEIALVATHRDHPAEKIWFERVADTATELGLPVMYADDPADPVLAAFVARARPDVIFSFYYRSMIPMAVLSLAARGAFNMHGSLLPHYRGRAPTNWAVLRGETETGATLHEMVTKPDAGAIVDRCAVPILPDDTARQVFDKVTVAAELVLWRSLPAIIAGSYQTLPNDLGAGSYFSARSPEDGRIDWNQPAAQVYNLIRAVAPPYPGAFTEVGGRKLVMAVARRLSADSGYDLSGCAPGLHVSRGRIVGLCGDGGLIEIRQLVSGTASISASALEALLMAHRGQSNS